MNVPHRSGTRDRRVDDVVDELIRRRFRSCESLPLFPELTSPLPRGFFDQPDMGRQMELELRLDRRDGPARTSAARVTGGRARGNLGDYSARKRRRSGLVAQDEQP